MLTTKPIGESSERTELRGMVEALLSRHLPPEEALACDREGRFQAEAWRALGKAGLLGLGGAEDIGGSGGTIGDALAVVEEIARVLPSLAVDFVLGGMAMRLLSDVDAGPVRQWLPQLAAGTMIGAFGLSEPSVGTDLLNLRTTARQHESEWTVDGQKLWTSLAPEADLIFTLARTDPVDPQRKSRGLSLIAVPADQSGVTIRRVHLAGMRAAMTSEVFFDGARAPLDHLVGARGLGLAALGRTLDVERVLAAGISLGIGRAALDLHVRYLGQREAFGRTIGAFQVLQHAAADSVTELLASRTLTSLAVATIEAGEPALELSAMAKLNAAEATARIVDRGMRAMGAMGLAEESAMQMYFRDARLQLFSPVSNEMVRNILGESLGLPRSY